MVKSICIYLFFKTELVIQMNGISIKIDNLDLNVSLHALY